MNQFKGKLKSVGYDQEEAHFFEVEKKLIMKQRDARRPALKLLQSGRSEQAANRNETPSLKKAS